MTEFKKAGEIMKLKDICIDLEYAKKLKELGVKQDSLFCFHTIDQIDSSCEYHLNKLDDIIKREHYYISAFTSDELLELLPEKLYEFYEEQIRFNLELGKHNGTEYYVAYTKFKDSEEVIKGGEGIFYNEKPVNALAEMPIYLIENKLMELK